jgi:hypothetical protein
VQARGIKLSCHFGGRVSLERSCVYKLIPWVHPHEGQKRDVYEAVVRPCTKTHWLIGRLKRRRFQQVDIGRHNDQQLGLEEGTYIMKEKAAAEEKI